jgi:tRNA-splicing ligase RtcB
MATKKDFRKISGYLWEIPKSFRSDMRVPARLYASEEMLEQILKDRSIDQLINGTTLPGIVKCAIAMPDCHEGYSVPIGFVGGMRVSDGVISPGACGFDVNCGMRLLKSIHSEGEVRPYLDKLAAEIQRQVPSGLGRGRQIKLSISQIDKILENGAEYLVRKGYGKNEDLINCEGEGRLNWADAKAVSLFAKNRGRDQVGTLGAGNHFLEIQEVAEIYNEDIAKKFGLFKGQIVVMIHSGSRGLGHQVCSDYLKLMIPLMEKYKIKVPDKEFACLPFNSKEGQRYFRAMAAAANYAWANRQMMSYYVRLAWRKILGEGEDLKLLYDVAHNIIKKEKCDIEGKEEEIIIHRKGATRAFPPFHPEIPSRYQETGQPVILPGSMGTASYILAGTEKGKEAFYTTAHGSGRVMSRQAAMRQIRGQQVVEALSAKGIIVKCWSNRRIAEEAPAAYKNIEEVAEIVDRAGLSQKVAKLKPLAVVKGE